MNACIDLGTSKLRLALLKRERPIMHKWGNEIETSADIFYSEKGRRIGNIPQDQIDKKPENYFKQIKSLIENYQPSDPTISNDLRDFGDYIEIGEKKLKVKIQNHVAFLISSLCMEIDVNSINFIIPPYWTNVQRNIILDAAEIIRNEKDIRVKLVSSTVAHLGYVLPQYVTKEDKSNLLLIDAGRGNKMITLVSVNRELVSEDDYRDQTEKEYKYYTKILAYGICSKDEDISVAIKRASFSTEVINFVSITGFNGVQKDFVQNVQKLYPDAKVVPTETDQPTSIFAIGSLFADSLIENNLLECDERPMSNIFIGNNFIETINKGEGIILEPDEYEVKQVVYSSIPLNDDLPKLTRFREDIIGKIIIDNKTEVNAKVSKKTGIIRIKTNDDSTYIDFTKLTEQESSSAADIESDLNEIEEEVRLLERAQNRLKELQNYFSQENANVHKDLQSIFGTIGDMIKTIDVDSLTKLEEVEEHNSRFLPLKQAIDVISRRCRSADLYKQYLENENVIDRPQQPPQQSYASQKWGECQRQLLEIVIRADKYIKNNEDKVQHAFVQRRSESLSMKKDQAIAQTEEAFSAADSELQKLKEQNLLENLDVEKLINDATPETINSVINYIRDCISSVDEVTTVMNNIPHYIQVITSDCNEEINQIENPRKRKELQEEYPESKYQKKPKNTKFHSFSLNSHGYKMCYDDYDDMD